MPSMNPEKRASMLTSRVLSALTSGPLTIHELAVRFDSDDRTIGKTVHALESRGRLVRVPTQYVITSNGRELLNKQTPEAIKARLQRRREREKARAMEKARIKRSAPDYVPPTRGRKPAPTPEVAPVVPITSKVDRAVCPTVEGASITKSAIRSMHPILSAWAQPVGEAA
jgi:hypothetical protein